MSVQLTEREVSLLLCFTVEFSNENFTSLFENVLPESSLLPVDSFNSFDFVFSSLFDSLSVKESHPQRIKNISKVINNCFMIKLLNRILLF